MSQNQNNNSGCLIPWGDDFLPIFMFCFHLNQEDPEIPLFEDEGGKGSENTDD